jgi:hypothetical protein
MKKIAGYIAVLAVLLTAHPVPAFAITCPAGEQVLNQGYGDYCDGTKSLTGSEQLPATSPNPVDPARQASSNQAYEQCMSIPGNNSQYCQQNAGAQTGVAPTNLDVKAPPLPSYLPTIATSSPQSPQQPFSAATPPSAQAAQKLTYTPLEPLPGGDANSYNSLSAYLALMFNILLSLGAMIAVVTLVFSGITYMVSEVVDKKSAARQRMLASVIGLGLLLTSWLILNSINPNLTKFSLLIPGSAAQATPGATQPTVTTPTAGTASSAQLVQQETSCQAQGANFHLAANQDGSITCQSTAVNATL